MLSLKTRTAFVSILPSFPTPGFCSSICLLNSLFRIWGRKIFRLHFVEKGQTQVLFCGIVLHIGSSTKSSRVKTPRSAL